MSEERMQLGTDEAATVIRWQDRRAELLRLCGTATGGGAEGGAPLRTQGMASLHVDGRRCEADGLALESVDEAGNTVTYCWRVGDNPLRLVTTWQGCSETGIVSRRDSLANTGSVPATVSRCLARVAFPPGRYECYTQTSRWCHENGGAWMPLHTGVALSHAWGRTTEGSTPYLALRAVGGEEGVAFHVLPRGNWTIRVSPVAVGGDLPFAVVELGLADENLSRELLPGDTLELPEILVQPLPRGQVRLAAPALHRYLLGRHFACAKPEAPVVYNTWFDQFEILDVPRLHEQLAAAKEVGCEVFVIDAGWYGAGGSNWGAQTGDWREKTEAAFRGRMREFADDVRAAGLGFGLWMEPERFGAEAPIRAEHPEWFVPVGHMARIDLTQPAADTWLRGEIGRLVETYELAWMKIDFNFALDHDASGAELADYTAAWYRLLDDIRGAYPNTFFEGCSSGAMRSDLATASHFDGHFLSDSVNPVDMLRISQGAWLRLPPGRLTRWTVVRSAGRVLPQYTKRVTDSPPTILTPGGALWEPAETMGLSFALLVAMPGMLGFSGDLASLSPEHRDLVRQAAAFYKTWRRFITGAVAHLLTPPEPIERREGWVGVQLRPPGDDTSLVFVYRLGNPGAPPRMRLHELDPQARYTIQHGFGGAAECESCNGADLLRDGLPLQRYGPANAGAGVFVVRLAEGGPEETPPAEA